MEFNDDVFYFKASKVPKQSVPTLADMRKGCLGYTAKEIAAFGHHLHRIIHAEDLIRFTDLRNGFRAIPVSAKQYLLRMKTKKGVWQWVLLQVVKTNVGCRPDIQILEMQEAVETSALKDFDVPVLPSTLILDRLATLSPRQREALRLIAEAKTDDKIAELMGISTKTIMVFKAQICQKLGAKNKADLIRIANHVGLDNIPEF
jgi:DNA-binding CsgD family transcriptional regulator